MLLFALVVSQLCTDSVHRMRSFFSGSTKVLQSSERSFLLEGWTKFAIAQSPHARSEAHSGKRSHALRTFRVLALDHHLLFNCYPAPSLFSLSRYIPAPVRVVERIIDLPTNPQVVQKHRELSRHGHHRSLL
jgi:hypothetical protein